MADSDTRERNEYDNNDDKGRTRDGDEGDRPRRPKVRAEDVNRMYTLKVDNIEKDVTEEDLRTEFGRFGEVGDVYIPRDHTRTAHRGFAFVRFVNRSDGNNAMTEMDGKQFMGRTLTIAEARQKKESRDEGRGGRRGRSSGRSRRDGSRDRSRRDGSRDRSRRYGSRDRSRRDGSRDRRRSRSTSRSNRRN